MKKTIILLIFLFTFNYVGACDIPLNLSKNNFKGNESIVQKIQLLLASDYDLYHPGYTTGYFGSLTEKAIKNLQSRYGAKETGIIDNTTQSLLCQMLDKNVCPIIGYNYSTGSTDLKNKNNDIILIQQLISNNPEYHTGYFGNITKNLLQNFQAQFGLNQTGIFDFDTYQFVCSILTNTSTPVVSNNSTQNTSVPDFSNTNIVKYLKSELIGKTLNIQLDISDLIENEEIYILFNQDKKGVYKTGNTLEIIYNIEENKIHKINQPQKISVFKKIKNYLFASLSMIEKLSSFLNLPLAVSPDNGVVQVLDYNQMFNFSKTPSTTISINPNKIIVQPKETEILKSTDYYLPVTLNIHNPYLRYLEYGIGNHFQDKYDFSVFDNHKYAESFYLEDFVDASLNKSGIPSSKSFYYSKDGWSFTEYPRTAPYSTLAINKYLKENPCSGIKQIPFYAMYLECPNISAEKFSDKIYEIKSNCCSDWYYFLQEDILKANQYSNPWYFDEKLIKDSIDKIGEDQRNSNKRCIDIYPNRNSSTAENNGYQYQGEYGKCVRHRIERWITYSDYCNFVQEVIPVNIDCKYTQYTKESITTTTKGALYHDKYIWKCDNITKKCFITENGNYLSQEQCEEYCSKDFLDNSNLYSFGTISHYTKKINLQILNKDGKVFEKDFHVLED